MIYNFSNYLMTINFFLISRKVVEKFFLRTIFLFINLSSTSILRQCTVESSLFVGDQCSLISRVTSTHEFMSPPTLNKVMNCPVL